MPEPARTSVPGSKQHAIYAVSWMKTEETVPYYLMWTANRSINALDVTKNYLDNSNEDLIQGFPGEGAELDVDNESYSQPQSGSSRQFRQVTLHQLG